MCSKIPYLTRTEARAQARYFNHHGMRQQRPYRCPHCDRWHLTSMSKATEKRLVKRRKNDERTTYADPE